MQQKLTRRKKILFGFLSILFGILVALFIMEGFLRIHPPAWLTEQMNSLNLDSGAQEFGSDAGWSVERIDGKFVEFTPLTHFKIKYYEYHNNVNIDRWGGRVVNGNVNRKDSVVVPFLGDSFMFGVGVEENQSFITLLNANSPLQYVNLGVPGSALPQHLDILDFRIKELGSPRVCIFSFFTGNDYTDIIKYYTRGPKGNLDSTKNQSHLLGALDVLIHRFHFLGRSYVMEYCRQILMSSSRQDEPEEERRKAWSERTPNGKRLANATFLLMEKDEPFRKDAETYLEMALDRLVKLSKKEHFLPIFIVIPDKHQVNQDLLHNKAAEYDLDLNDFDPKLPDKIIGEELQRREIPYYDLFDCLNGQTGMYYKIDDHFTPAGCRRVSQCLRDLNTTIAQNMQPNPAEEKSNNR